MYSAAAQMGNTIECVHSVRFYWAFLRQPSHQLESDISVTLPIILKLLSLLFINGPNAGESAGSQESLHQQNGTVYQSKIFIPTTPYRCNSAKEARMYACMPLMMSSTKWSKFSSNWMSSQRKIIRRSETIVKNWSHSRKHCGIKI